MVRASHQSSEGCGFGSSSGAAKSFSEDRTWQINSWKENQKYFLKFLTKYRLNKLYAYGSYYFLLYKILRLRDLNLNLFLSYIIFYPYNLFKKFISYLK